MADNSTLPVSVGTEVFANDDIGGVKYPRTKATFGADGSSTDVSPAAPLPVAPYASYSASATFTPAATSHTGFGAGTSCGDVVGAAAEFASMGPSAGRVMITSASITFVTTTPIASALRLALFNITPPSAAADDAAYTLPSGDIASFLGFIELGTAVDEVATQHIEVHGINKQVKLAGTSIFAYLLNRTTATFEAIGHVATLHTQAV